MRGMAVVTSGFKGLLVGLLLQRTSKLTSLVNIYSIVPLNINLNLCNNLFTKFGLL